jgi:hypothetical protein
MSTKTTFKRVALVTVAALGFGVLAATSPAYAVDVYTASFTAPSTAVVQTNAADTATSRDLGTIQVTLTATDRFVVGSDTATITMAAQTGATSGAQALNDAFLAKLTLSTASNAVVGAAGVPAVATASNDYNFASTGFNVLNGATYGSPAAFIVS